MLGGGGLCRFGGGLGKRIKRRVRCEMCGSLRDFGWTCFPGRFMGEMGKAECERKICEEISAVQASEIMISGLPSGISEEINDKCRDNRFVVQSKSVSGVSRI
jgi:hypothetical protein